VSDHRTRLAQLVDEWNLSRDEVIKRFHRAGQELMARREVDERIDVSPRQLGRWMSGESSDPRPAARRVLEHMFQTTIAELLGPPYRHSDLVRPAPAPAAVIERVDNRAARRGAGNVYRLVVGERIEVPSAGEREVLLEMSAERASKFALVAGQSGLTAEAVEQIYEDVRRLAVAYPRRPLPEVLGKLVDAQDTVFTLLEARQRPAHARQLYFLAGITGGLLAKASHDLSNPAAAMTHARTAFICADQVDHNGLRAWIRGLQSLVSYWAHRPHDAIRYAQSGRGCLSDSGTSVVWLDVSEARGWAALGNVQEARSAIERAEQARERVHPDDLDQIGGICTFGRVRQLYYTADTLAWLPSEAATAADYSLQAVQAYGDANGPEWAFGDQAGAHADLSIARIAQGELEGAAEALAPVLELPPEERINGVVVSTQRVYNALRSTALPSRDLQEAIEVFGRTPVAALPR